MTMRERKAGAAKDQAVKLPSRGSGKTSAQSRKLWIVCGICGTLLAVGAVVMLQSYLWTDAGVNTSKETGSTRSKSRAAIKEKAEDVEQKQPPKPSVVQSGINPAAGSDPRRPVHIDFPSPPDVRPKKCAAKTPRYDTGNATVSIVIPFLREKYEYMVGTVGAILEKTPLDMLEEIIFISDGNTDEEAHQAEIEALSPLIRMIRLPTRHGLIYAKMLGAKQSRGDIVMFFEPHCIVNTNWLEPLVHMVLKKPKSLVLPTLDYIPQTDFNQYSRAAMGRYRFEWNFNLIYTNPPTGVDENTANPYFAPATSGGIFAIKKERFLELRLFDVGMKQWGGDQIELSFKAWRCGGTILVIPCSRVGHLFRDVAYRPYPVDVPTVVENYAKLARVWLEPPYLESFYLVKPESRAMARDANLTEPRNTFKELQCKPMSWYITHVDLELGWEVDKICVPGASPIHNGCTGPAARGRSCVDRVMPAHDYAAWSLRSKFFNKKRKNNQATNGGASSVGEDSTDSVTDL